VTGAVFAPGGAALASGAFDGKVLLWNTFGEVGAYQALQHAKAVLSVAWGSDGAHVFSASADQSVCVWDAETGERVRRARGHGGVVNDVAPAAGEPRLYASGCDDGAARLWDARQARCVAAMSSAHQVLAVALARDASLLYWAGIDDRVQVHDARKTEQPLLRLAGHREAVTSLALSADGSYLLSNARDNTVRIWDARPFSARANLPQDICRCNARQ
jgi:Prp8 binding protein